MVLCRFATLQAHLPSVKDLQIHMAAKWTHSRDPVPLLETLLIVMFLICLAVIFNSNIPQPPASHFSTHARTPIVECCCSKPQDAQVSACLAAHPAPEDEI
jgi:hypothetical protein